MKKEYFLTKMVLYTEALDRTTEITQLVKSSDKKSARYIVQDKAMEDGHLEKDIHEIIVYDTLVGD